MENMILDICPVCKSRNAMRLEHCEVCGAKLVKYIEGSESHSENPYKNFKKGNF